MENLLASKLDYLHAININSKNNTKQFLHSQVNSKENYVKEFAILNQILKKKLGEIKINPDLKKLELVNKKFDILKTYVYLVCFTISLKYIDILVKVKYGGLIYSLGVFSLFYYSMKYFSQYKSFFLFDQLCRISNKSHFELIKDYKQEISAKSDEESLRKLSLHKYWKEPMAWH